MNIPDPAVYASIPVLGGAIVWVGRQFIREQNRRDGLDTETQRIQARRDDQPITNYLTLSVRDWASIMEQIEKRFNGRYWQATEARAAMKEIREHSEQQTQRLHDRISKLGDEIRQDLSEKVDKP